MKFGLNRYDSLKSVQTSNNLNKTVPSSNWSNDFNVSKVSEQKLIQQVKRLYYHILYVRASFLEEYYHF